MDHPWRCARPGCGGPASALLRYDYAMQTAWIDDVVEQVDAERGNFVFCHEASIRNRRDNRGTRPIVKSFGGGRRFLRRWQRCWLFGGEELGWDGALAMVVPEPGSQVFVALYDLSPYDHEVLDYWEGADTGLYNKIKLRVSTLDGDVLAWVYILDGYEGGLPSALASRRGSCTSRSRRRSRLSMCWQNAIAKRPSASCVYSGPKTDTALSMRARHR